MSPEFDARGGKAPAGAAETSPQIALVVFHPAAAQKLEVFFLEGLPSMMFLLARDVVANRFAVWSANGECPVAVLPKSRTLAHLLMHPARGHSLQITNDISEPMCGF